MPPGTRLGSPRRTALSFDQSLKGADPHRRHELHQRFLELGHRFTDRPDQRRGRRRHRHYHPRQHLACRVLTGRRAGHRDKLGVSGCRDRADERHGGFDVHPEDVSVFGGCRYRHGERCLDRVRREVLVPSKAERYESLYPNTGCSDAQKQERMERMDFKAESASLSRTGRTRGIVIPAGNPWIESLSREKTA